MRTRLKLSLAALVAAGIGLGVLLGGIFREGAGSAAGAPPALAGQLGLQGAADRALAGGGAGASGPRTEELEAAVAARPNDPVALTTLGYVYLQRWRETADASLLPRASAALRRALRLAPDDPLVLTGLGSLALTKHEFRNALSLGRRAARLAPGSARPYGIVGDALLELGRYEEAFAALERMVSLKPNVASYARIAYARELIGDRDGAIAAMGLALDAAGGQPEPAAWAGVELAKLELAAGRLDRAERLLRSALALRPQYVFALEQLARVEAARGNISRALRHARAAAESVPLPQLVGLLADLLERAGRRAESRRQVATVGAIDRLIADNGIRTDLESALFDADHGLRTSTLVERARAARAARPSIYGDDTLAWAHARTGDCRAALPWSKRALRLGTRDALLFFHRAYIERCLGDRAEARAWARRALELGPSFSVRWDALARRLAA
jgi:tetratricopeptide (TPR) repeat protein